MVGHARVGHQDCRQQPVANAHFHQRQHHHVDAGEQEPDQDASICRRRLVGYQPGMAFHVGSGQHQKQLYLAQPDSRCHYRRAERQHQYQPERHLARRLHGHRFARPVELLSEGLLRPLWPRPGQLERPARRPGVHAECRRLLQGNQRRRARRQTRSRIDQELRGQCGSTGRVRRRVSVQPPERDVDSRFELPVGTDVQRRSRLWLEAVVHAVRQLPAQ